MADQRRTLSAGIIERADGAVLICRGGEGAGWTLPHAELRRGESPEAAMRRAAREGVGLDVTVSLGQPPTEQDVAGRPAMVRYFICHIRSGEATPRGFDEVRWVLPGQLCEYDFQPGIDRVMTWYVA